MYRGFAPQHSVKSESQSCRADVTGTHALADPQTAAERAGSGAAAAEFWEAFLQIISIITDFTVSCGI